MKKTRFCILLAALLLASTPVFALGNSAKSLAKQVQNLSKKAAELEEKAAGIEEKALALSDRDRRAYQAELERLGFQPPPGLFNDGETLLTGAPEAPESPGGILGAIGGLLGGGSRSSGGGSRSSGSSAPTEAEIQAALEAVLGGGAASTPAPSTTTTPTQSATPTTPSEPGTFTLTGIPSQYNGKYALLTGDDSRGVLDVIGAQSLNFLGRGDVDIAFPQIRNGRVTLNIWTDMSPSGATPYRGNDTLIVTIAITDIATTNTNEEQPTAESGVGFESVSFRNGSATAAWGNGIVDGISSSTDTGTFTLTGIPSQYNGKYAVVSGENRDAAVMGAQTIANVERELTVTLTPIRSGRAAMNLWRVTPVGFVPYKGSDAFEVTVMIYDQVVVKMSEEPTEEVSVEFASVSFRNGAASQAWSAGTVQEITHTYSSAWSFDETQHWHDCTDNDGAKSGVGNHTSANTCTVCGYWKWTIIENSLFGSINAIAWGNNRWVAVGRNGTITYSPDGISWTAVEDRPFSWTYNDIAWGNGRFVAVAESGRMAYSDDGVSWTAVANGVFGGASIRAIAYGNNRWVAGGYGGTMAYSADGISWTAVADSTFGTGTNGIVSAIAWGNNRFVAGGWRKMAYSSDGVSWTAVADSTFGIINDIAYGGGRFVAVDQDGGMAYSADGRSWTAVADRPLSSLISAIAWGNGRFVAGRYGMAYSADGVRWTFGTNFRTTSIAYGNGRFVAGGDGNSIAYADW